MEFINTARELLVFTIKLCTKLPKRYDRYFGSDIVKLANKVFDCVVSANDIFPTSKREATLRLNLLTEASYSLASLIARASVAEELLTNNEWSPKQIEHWMILMASEKKLITGIRKKDKEKLTKLKE